jgi:hypothetical protein
MVAVGPLLACASTSRLTGTARPPIAVSEVAVYRTAPLMFQEIAVVSASRKTLFNPGGRYSADKIIDRLKAAAARVGANGLVLDQLDQTQTGSFASGAGSDSYSAHGTISLGVGASIGIYKTTGQGRAIYVPPDLH